MFGNSIVPDYHEWIAQNLSHDNLTVEVLAQQVQMSPRNFARVYKLKTGRTSAKAVEVLRLEAARRLLGESERNIEQIARGVRVGDEERMRFTFQRNPGFHLGSIGGGFRGDEGSLEQTSFVRIWLDHSTMFAPLMAKHYVAM